MPGIVQTGRWITVKRQRSRRIRFGLSPTVAVGYFIPTRCWRMRRSTSSKSAGPLRRRFSSERSIDSNSSRKGRAFAVRWTLEESSAEMPSPSSSTMG
jgi:hypothetical protein